jgi:hypothetical protein
MLNVVTNFESEDRVESEHHLHGGREMTMIFKKEEEEKSTVHLPL